ncbi:MAG TPA: TonB-dependent receptor, partial [Longimicrobium sp.]|nr:TonB-dependent receptor [Longimicrobium sp.]
MTIRLAIAAAALSLACAAPLAAQDGSLAGVVVEAGTGRPVAGARVSVAGAAALRAGDDGRWSATALAPGAYRVRVEAVGYAPREVEARVPGPAVRVALETAPLALGAVVATASRRPQALADAPVATELISRAEIERSGAPDLAALLRGRAGTEAQGGHPVGAGILLEGIGAERVLVLVDGEPVVGRISGVVDLSRIATAGVERVEIVKGPQSTLYGSEAMGGVIQVVTRRPEAGAWDGSAQVTAGSEGRMDADARWSGSAGALAWTAAAGRRALDQAPGVDLDAGAYSGRTDGRLRVAWTASPDLRFEASGSIVDEAQHWRSGQITQFADNREWSARAGAEWRAGAHRLAPAVYVTAFDHLARAGTGTRPGGEGDPETQRLAEAELVYAFAAGAFALDAGVEGRREAITSGRVEGGERELVSGDGYAQGTWTAGRWTVVPGARLSASERWGTHWTPRMAVLFRPVPALALRASAGAGYRAPAFKELYMTFLNATPDFTYAVRGNPDLQPETSRNLTVGVEWAGPTFYAT